MHGWNQIDCQNKITKTVIFRVDFEFSQAIWGETFYNRDEDFYTKQKFGKKKIDKPPYKNEQWSDYDGKLGPAAIYQGITANRQNTLNTENWPHEECDMGNS